MIGAIKVISTNGDTHEFTEVDHLSLVNEESYGPARTFGVREDDDGHVTLIVCTQNTVAVEVES